MRRDPARAKRGFTLLEALVALAVVGFILVPMLQVFVSSRVTSRAASRELAARLVFDRVLARLPVAVGEQIDPQKGTDGGFAWSLSASVIRQDAVAAAPDAAGDAPTFAPYRVRITLVDGARSSTIETVRLGPPPPPPEEQSQ